MAGGVPAGRLEIEIVAEIAKLQADMKKVEREVGKMADGVNTKTKAVNDNIAGMGRSFGNVTSASGKTAFGLRNLGYQVQDLGVQFAQATQAGDPFKAMLMALIQQGPQISDALDQTGLSLVDLAKRIAANAARFGVFAVAAGAGVYHLKQFTGELENSAGADKFIQTLGLTADEIKKLENTTVSFGDVALGTWDVISGGIMSVIGPSVAQAKAWFDDWFAQTNANGAKLINDLVGFFVGGFNAIGAVWSKLPAAMADTATSAANVTISAINKMIQMAVNGMNGLISTANNALGLDIGTLSAPQIGAIENSFAGAGKGAWEAFKTTFQAGQKDYWGQFTNAVGDAAVARRNARLRAQADELIGDRSDKKGGAAKKAKEMDDLAKALERAIKESTRYAEALELETSRIGKSAIEIKRMEVAANAAIAPTEELRQRILAAGKAWEEATRAQAEADWRENVIRPLEEELALLGKVGPERELAALALEEQAMKAKWAKDGITDVNAAWEEYLRLRTKIINGKSALEEEAEKAKILNDRLRETVSILDSMGGVAKGIGTIFGILTGNYQGISGPLGDLLNMETGSYRKDAKTGKIIAEKIGDQLKDVFGAGGEFGKTMESALAGAGIGASLGQSLGGKTGSSIGAAIGAIAGSEFMAAVSGPLALASAANSIIGDIFGFEGGPLGVFTGLFKKTKSGGATLTGANQFSVFGNSGSRRDAAGDLAGSVMDGLNNIAKALGGSFSGGFNTTIGIRGKDYRVNPNGTSLKTSKGAIDFGQDAQAAIAYAIQDAIKDGALMGLRAGTQALLQKEGDFEAQLQKALAFEGVFRDLKAMTNPLVGGLEDLAAKFKELQAIFTEAGASAEEFAQLQEYMTKQQQALIDSISSTYKSLFLTDKEALAAAKKTIKDTLAPLGKGSVDTVAEYKALVKATDALKDPELYGTLMELADEFGVIQDAAEAAKEAAAAQKALAEALKAQKGALQVELLKAQGKTLEATAKQREMELAAMDASLRPLQKQVWAHQDLAEVYERESAGLQDTIDTFGKLGDTLREFRRGLYQTDDATNAYAVRLAELQRVGNLAGLGDKDAMGLLPGVGQDFLDVARKQAGSLQDYQRDVARVARYADSAIGAADGMVSEAQAQLDVLEEQVSQFIQLNDTALSIEAALAAMVVPVAETPQANREIASRLDRNNELLERLHIAMESGALASIDMNRTLKRVTRDGTALATTEAA